MIVHLTRRLEELMAIVSVSVMSFTPSTLMHAQ